MMMAIDVARIIQLNGGRLVGKTRLQKSAYFLETKGIGFGFDFDYHHYGPFSEELSNSTDDAAALGLLDVDWRNSQSGSQYAIFIQKGPPNSEEPADGLRRQVLDVLRNYSAIEVELAATADFLKTHGYSKDPWGETQRRKSSKVNVDRLSRAQQLLSEMANIG